MTPLPRTGSADAGDEDAIVATERTVGALSRAVLVRRRRRAREAQANDDCEAVVFHKSADILRDSRDISSGSWSTSRRCR
jgi:hypothetical protein